MKVLSVHIRGLSVQKGARERKASCICVSLSVHYFIPKRNILSAIHHYLPPILSGLLVTLLLSCQPKEKAETQPPAPTRGVWLTNVVSEAMFSREGIEEAVELCRQYGFNTIYVVTWNRGYTLYPSAVMEEAFGIPIDPKHAGRDPLQETIDAAHARGMRVIAWFEFGFSSSYQEDDGGHILRTRPHWAARDTAGNIVSKNGFQWMNAFDPQVQDFVLSLLREVAQHYAVDGIQGDDRLPALPSLAGYDSLTVARYRVEHQGRQPPRDIFDPAWVDWRAGILNDFMQRMSGELKAVRPDLTVSVSPSIYPWSKEQYLQDWPTWVNNGWVDEVCPQIYRYDIEKYRNELSKIMTAQVDSAYHNIVSPGILLRVGDYYAPDTLLRQNVAENRKWGIEGEVFFYYEGLKKRPAFFEALYD